MRALLLEDVSRLVVADLPEPVPAAGEVVVGVRACGICGSDVHGYDGTSGRRTPPLVMGHEAAGVIVAVGSGVAAWREGDRVTFDSTLFCGACPACASGATNMCVRRRVLGSAFAGVRTDGAFAERVAVPVPVLARVPDVVAFEHAAFAEPLAVALHAVRLSRAGPGATVGVVGTGVIGLLAIQALRAAGAERVVGVDLDPGKLELASRLGADAVVHARDVPDPGAALAELCGGGADAVIEAVGTGASIRTAVGGVRRRGRVVLVGNLSPEAPIPLQAVVTGEIELAGSCASSGELAHGVELLASGEVDVAPLIGAVAPLEEGPEWFARLHAHEPGLLKVLLTP